MGHSFKLHSHLCLLAALLVVGPVKSFAQAFVLGNNPAFTALNLNNRKPLDTLLLEVRYQFTWTCFGDSATHDGQRTLLVGLNHVCSRNEDLYQNDSVATSLMAKGAKGVALYSNPTVSYEVWTDHQANTVEIGYRIPFDNMVVAFSMPANNLQWNFSDEDKQDVLGYSCSKATTTYRGRTVTAWFAEDLPYDAGPYCFSGLPGLIMKVRMGNEEWRAVGLRKGRKQERIYTYARPRQLMPREKAINFLSHLYDDPVGTYSSLGVECSSADNPNQVLAPGSMSWRIPSLMILER